MQPQPTTPAPSFVSDSPQDDAGLVVDLFAGGGGMSHALARAYGRVDIAINHDPIALATHAANHPGTTHYATGVHEVSPIHACAGRPCRHLHASPDCTYHSRAKGAKPLRDHERRVRALAWVVVRWAALVRPAVITMENVVEFEKWGPVRRGRPVKKHAGQYFTRFVEHLRSLGYTVDWQHLTACDYGAPTTRTRLFIVARYDGQDVVWPKATHGPATAQPYRTAAECIDWSDQGTSIYNRPRPLAEKTMARIQKGFQRYVVDAEHPFVVPGSCADDQIATAWIAKHYTGVTGHDVRRPLGTITTKDHHSLCTAFLIKYYGSGGHQGLPEPLHTITTKARHALVQPIVSMDGDTYRVVDIRMRMLRPHELAKAQGFAPDYRLPAHVTNATRLIGNSVSPAPGYALVAANAAPPCEHPTEPRQNPAAPHAAHSTPNPLPTTYGQQLELFPAIA